LGRGERAEEKDNAIRRSREKDVMAACVDNLFPPEKEGGLPLERGVSNSALDLLLFGPCVQELNFLRSKI